MRSEHPYTDSIYNRRRRPPPPPPPTSLANPSHPPPPLPTRNSSLKRTASTRSKTLTAALSGPTGPPPPPHTQTQTQQQQQQQQQLPLIRASPLQSRDPNQHVLSLTSTTTRSTTKKNTPARPVTPVTPVTTPIMAPPGERPRQPQLSASAAKAMSRTPLTPKMVVVGTPLGKRTPTAAAAAAAAASKEDAYAAAPYLSNNVTPRSGPRQSRVNSTGTTPSGTPNPERMGDTWDGSGRGGLAMSPFAIGEGVGYRRSLGDSSSGESRNESKFFYASDAKPVHQPVPPPRPSSAVHQKNMPTFFYASDATAPSKRMTSPPMHPASTPTLGPTQEGIASKFFYANGTPDVDSRPSLASSGTGSASSSGSRTMARPGTSHSTAGFGTPMFSRPASPVKPSLQSSTPLPPLRSNAMSPTSPRAQAYSPPMLAPTTNPASKRRISIDAPPRVRKGHARMGSLPTAESFAGPRFAVPPSEPTSPPLSPGLAQPAMTMASMLQIADELDEDDEDDEEEEEEEEDDEDEDEDGDEDLESESRSRKKSSKAADPVNDLVANARRERKVQDLEITNASLEAINRTLERQLRKQTAELRRYRRLSRAGRLKGASAASSRVPSVSVSEPPADLSDLSEEESGPEEDEGEEEDEDEEEQDSLDDSESSGEEPAADTQPSNTQSPSSKRRKRDERRLQLDLTKHQELLLDSQKMNQSLKRCLNWTEELIKEGQKALAHRVKVSEVELFGGRVLAPSYYDYDDDASHLAEDTVSNVDSRLAEDTISNVDSEPEPWIKGPQDRDSGIELPVDGG